MHHSVRIARIGETEIALHWSTIALLAMLTMVAAPELVSVGGTTAGWLTAGLTSFLLLVAVVAHELGHASVAIRRGVPVPRITVWALGGLAELGTRPPDASGTVLVALAGPAVSAALGAVGLGVAVVAGFANWELVAAAAAWLGGLNLMLAVFNALPATPLDGGRALAGLVWWRTGSRARGQLVAARCGRLFGSFLLVLGLFALFAGGNGLWLLAIGWFVLMGSVREEAMARVELASVGHIAVDICAPLGPPVSAGVTAHGMAAMGLQGVCPVMGLGYEAVVDLTGITRAEPTRTAGEMAVGVEGRSVYAAESLPHVIDEMLIMGPGPVLVRSEDGELLGLLDLRLLSKASPAT